MPVICGSVLLIQSIVSGAGVVYSFACLGVSKPVKEVTHWYLEAGVAFPFSGQLEDLINFSLIKLICLNCFFIFFLEANLFMFCHFFSP